MLDLWVIRHAETLWNRENRLQGSRDIAISDLGAAQAASLGARLAAIGFDAVYTSPLLRCRQTLEAVRTARNGGPALPEARTADPLHEIRCGDWEGVDMGLLRQEQPEAWQTWLAEPEARCPNGESFADVARRVTPFLDSLLERHPDGRVLLCSHGGVNRMILASLLRLDVQRSRYFQQDNACVNRFRMEPGQPVRVRLWNCTAHIPENPS